MLILLVMGFLAVQIGRQAAKRQRPTAPQAESIPVETPEAEELYLTETNYASGDGVNVRSGPGESHPVVRTLAAGEEVRVLPSGPLVGLWRRLGEPVGGGNMSRPLNEWVHASLLDSKPPETAEQRRARVALEAENRRAYAKVLRELFLDQGLDIEVRVTGSRAERLKLTYVLFNDVWSHRFNKDGLIDQWLGMGFEKIDLDDGYDYHIVWSRK